jgi:CheY-like chemotaxis protein
MPEMDGFEFLQKYNEEGIKTPVVVISADVQDLTKLKCYELGVIRFLNKPPTKEELFSALNDAIKLRN